MSPHLPQFVKTYGALQVVWTAESCTHLTMLWSPRATDRLITSSIPAGGLDKELQWFPSTYFVYWNMYFKITATFKPKLQLKNILNPLLSLIQDKNVLESRRVQVNIEKVAYCTKYRCTQTIVNKHNYTTTKAHTEVWSSVSESSNILAFNVLDCFYCIQYVLA